MTDIHCHILYGLDDGAQSLQDSRRMLSAAQAVGIDYIIATPHVRQLPFHLELAYQRQEELSKYAKQKGIQLNLGFEVHWNTLYSLDAAALSHLCLQNTKHLLVEFSLSAEELPQDHDQMIYRLQRQGFHIIIAHPERYRFVQTDNSLTDRWKDMGCELQLDVNCLLRPYERRSKPVARKLWRSGVYDYAASDAHCPEDYELYTKAMDWANRHT